MHIPGSHSSCWQVVLLCLLALPGSTCLCLGFLSFSLPLQIFSNATEECSNVVEVISNEQERCFFFQLILHEAAVLKPNPPLLLIPLTAAKCLSEDSLSLS